MRASFQVVGILILSWVDRQLCCFSEHKFRLRGNKPKLGDSFFKLRNKSLDDFMSSYKTLHFCNKGIFETSFFGMFWEDYFDCCKPFSFEPWTTIDKIDESFLLFDLFYSSGIGSFSFNHIKRSAYWYGYCSIATFWKIFNISYGSQVNPKANSLSRLGPVGKVRVLADFYYSECMGKLNIQPNPYLILPM